MASGIRNEHIDGPLSRFASAYAPPGFVADIVSPPVLVDSISDEFHKRRRRDMATLHDDLIAADGEANRSTFEYESASFVCKHRALVDYVSNADLANADVALDLMQDATAHILNRMALNREKRVADVFGTASNYASANTFAGTDWTDESLGNPLADLQRARRVLPPGGGASPSKVVLVCDELIFDALAKHPALRGGGNLTSVLTANEIAQRLRIDEIHVSDAEYNTANEGQTPSYSPIWDATKAWLVRVPVGTPTTRTSSFSVTFRFRAGASTVPAGTPGVQGVAVRRWEDPAKGPYGSQAIQPAMSDAEHVVQDDMAVMITGLTG